MLPTWMIEEMARERREREAREEQRPRLWVEVPVHDERSERSTPEPEPSLVTIVIYGEEP